MTSFQTIGITFVIMIISCLMMAAIFEPVALDTDAGAHKQQIAIAALSPAAIESAAL